MFKEDFDSTEFKPARMVWMTPGKLMEIPWPEPDADAEGKEEKPEGPPTREQFLTDEGHEIAMAQYEAAKAEKTATAAKKPDKGSKERMKKTVPESKAVKAAREAARVRRETRARLRRQEIALSKKIKTEAKKTLLQNVYAVRGFLEGLKKPISWREWNKRFAKAMGLEDKSAMYVRATVRALQGVLEVTKDGKLGPKTAVALAAYIGGITNFEIDPKDTDTLNRQLDAEEKYVWKRGELEKAYARILGKRMPVNFGKVLTELVNLIEVRHISNKAYLLGSLYKLNHAVFIKDWAYTKVLTPEQQKKAKQYSDKYLGTGPKKLAEVKEDEEPDIHYLQLKERALSLVDAASFENLKEACTIVCLPEDVKKIQKYTKNDRPKLEKIFRALVSEHIQDKQDIRFAITLLKQTGEVEEEEDVRVAQAETGESEEETMPG